ncbi:hypothetical protein APS56_15790 [Pseudalgibacter alginicilyticus]|uniref:Uncharacterized protein n=1 Tax=Pseudalgibacter alginicilyticus TaxID=1736674 RepID=A0A0P0CJU7_9FLAO|nr:hypothetical protein APS56_15790 [Pseudalgibacter alginicilyticus]
MANFPDSDSSLTRAYNYFNKKRLESINQNDTKSVIVYLRKIAIIQFELGDYFGSEVTVVEALELLDKFQLSKEKMSDKIGLLNQLGRIYMELLDYDAAIKYYDEALKITKSKNHRNIIQNNKALVYIQQQNYKLAEKEFLEVFRNSDSLENKEQIARAQNNLGHVQSKLNRSDALANLTEALRIRMSIKDNAGIYSSYRYLSEYYHDRNNDSIANDYAHKGYHIAKLINSPSFIKDALSNLMNLGNYSNKNVLEYIRVSDSLQNVKQLQENKYTKIKYDYTENEKLAKVNELEKEKQRRLKLLYLSVAGFVTLLAVFVIVILKIKYKRDKLRQVYITETRISKRVHDEVANDVYQVMTKLQGNIIDNKEVLLDDLEDIYNRTRDISRDNSTLEVNEHFDILLNDLLVKYKSTQVNIVTRNLSKMDWNTVDALKKITIYRVIQELMVNMKKHSKASLVGLNFNYSDNKIIVSYSDNGVGCNIKSGSGGLKNAENRIESINGTIIFESGLYKGFKAKITV